MTKTPTTSTLSRRETEVVAALARGKQPRAVAERLDISVNTALAHLYRAMRKLRVRNRASLTLKAVALGLVRCPCPEHAASRSRVKA